MELGDAAAAAQARALYTEVAATMRAGRQRRARLRQAVLLAAGGGLALLCLAHLAAYAPLPPDGEALLAGGLFLAVIWAGDRAIPMKARRG